MIKKNKGKKLSDVRLSMVLGMVDELDGMSFLGTRVSPERFTVPTQYPGQDGRAFMCYAGAALGGVLFGTELSKNDFGAWTLREFERIETACNTPGNVVNTPQEALKFLESAGLA